MGSSRQQVSSALPTQAVVPGTADDVCVVGGNADDVCVVSDGLNTVGGDADHICVVGNDIDGVGDDVCVVADDAIISRKSEILTGSDALRFLYANSGTGKQARMKKSYSFSKLFSTMLTEESTVSRLESPPPTSSVLASSRKQRKAYRPSRFPPLEEVESLPPKKKESLVLDNLVSLKAYDHKKGKKNGFSNIRAIKDNHELLLMADGKRNKQLNSARQNDVVLCKNLACKAVLQAGASFCRRCSCCICKEFDDNKDPSLWITCDSEEHGCGLSCHVECALQTRVAGVIKKRGSILLDGSFVCKSCGKISSLIGLWRRQLLIAKGARRVDVLCHRLFLSHRLLKGTLKYKDAHTLLDGAVEKLEAEVSLMNKGSAKLERCIVNRLSCNTEVQERVDLALERAESLGDAQSAVLDAHDAATREKALYTMQFEDVCSSSIVVVAVDTYASGDILGYKLWHRKATNPSYPETPTYTIQSPSKKVSVSDLQSSTPYVFKLAPFASHGDKEECEAECSTEGMNSTVVENHDNDAVMDHALRDDTNHGVTSVVEDPQHRSCVKFQSIQKGRVDSHGVRPVDDLSRGKAPLVAKADEGKGDHFMKDPDDVQHLEHRFPIQRLVISEKDGFCNGVTSSGELEKGREELSVSRVEVDASPLSLAKAVIVDVTDNRNVGSQSWALQLHCYDAQSEMLSKDIASDGRDGFFRNASVYSSEFSIKVVRWLECQGHLDKEFRMKFLTWYSLRASEHEKRVVSMFIETLRDSPASLAAQLVDAFQEIINFKRQRAAESGYFNRPYQ